MATSDPHLKAMISTKGVLRNRGRILLVKNARSEWELPGGKIEHGESLEQSLAREFHEEVGIPVQALRLLAAYTHHHYDDIVVLVYDCGTREDPTYTLSDEHSDGGWYDAKQIQTMNVPENYRRVIAQLSAIDAGHVE